MQIKNDGFSLKLIGKMTTTEDILQAFKFGMTKKGITQKYAKDNKIKILEAQEVVEKSIYNSIIGGVLWKIKKLNIQTEDIHI